METRKTTWLRAIIRRFGTPGLLFVGAYLLLHSLCSDTPRRRRALAGAFLLAATCLTLRAHHSRPASSANPTPGNDWIAADVTLTDLGELPGYPFTFGYNVNNRGEVVGTAVDKDGEKTRAFFWRNGKMQALPDLGGPLNVACQINDRGEIAGFALARDKRFRAVRWLNGKIQDLGTLGGRDGLGEGLNNQGQIVGGAALANDEFHAFLWQNGAMKDIGKAGGMVNVATQINDAGQIAGYRLDEDKDIFRAFFAQNGKFTDIAPLGDGSDNLALAINSRGLVVGYSTLDANSNSIHAFAWQNSQTRDIGTLGGADSLGIGVSDKGLIVGWSETADNKYHAFISNGQRMADLNLFAPPNSGWTLIQANSVNSRDQIVGWGRVNGKFHAYLLTPQRD